MESLKNKKLVILGMKSIMCKFKGVERIFFCDKDKLINLKDKRVWTNIWGPIFSIYLQLCH